MKEVPSLSEGQPKSREAVSKRLAEIKASFDVAEPRNYRSGSSTSRSTADCHSAGGFEITPAMGRDLIFCAQYFSDEASQSSREFKRVQNERDSALAELASLRVQMDASYDQKAEKKKHDRLQLLEKITNCDQLVENICSMQEDIRRLEYSTGEPQGGSASSGPRRNATRYLPDPVLVRARAESDDEAFVDLIQMKFDLVDDTVFSLKRGLLQMEGNRQLATIMGQFGSLENLMEENAVLRKENMFLKRRDERFATDPLLCSRDWEKCSRDFMTQLVGALQNELNAATSMIKAFNLSDNRALAALLCWPKPPPDVHCFLTLREDMAAADVSEPGFSQAPASSSSGGRQKPPAVVDCHPNLREINQLRSTVTELKAQVASLEREKILRKDVEGVADRLQTEYGHRMSCKDATIKEMLHQNGCLLTELNRSAEALKLRLQEKAELNRVLSQMQHRCQDLTADNIHSNDRCLKLLAQRERLTFSIRKQNQALESLYLLSHSLVLDSLGKHLTEPERKTFISQFYNDLHKTYIAACKAAVKIQSQYRGRASRRLQSMGQSCMLSDVHRRSPQMTSKIPPGMAQRGGQIAKAGGNTYVAPTTPFKSPSSNPGGWFAGGSPAASQTAASIGVAGVELSPYLPTVSKELTAPFMEPFKALTEIVCHSERDMHAVSQFPVMLKIVRSTVLEQVREEAKHEIALAKAHMNKQIKAIGESMEVVLGGRKRDAECQMRLEVEVCVVVHYLKHLFGLSSHMFLLFLPTTGNCYTNRWCRACFQKLRNRYR